MAEPPADVNERVAADWEDETTPYERVRTVMQRTYEAEPVDVIAERACTTPTTVRKHLRILAEDGFVEETAEPDRSGTLYRRSKESLVLEQAQHLLSEVDSETLTTRVSEMQRTIREHRDEWGVESPEDAVLWDAEIDAETLQEWQTTRRNLGFAKVALALSEATDDVDTTQAAR